MIWRIKMLALVVIAIGLLSVNVLAQDEIAAEFPKTNTPPVIDGMGDDAVWASSTAHGTEEFFELATPLDGDEDLQITWKALWDDENLYVLLEIQDDEIINFESFNWDDDSLEIYIDAQDTNELEYNPSSVQRIPAYQFTAVAGQEPIDGTTTLFTQGINSYATFDGQYPRDADTCAMIWSEDPGFYSFEVAFPWVALEETPANIMNRGSFGFGIAINDDDDGAGRDTQIMWATQRDDLWHVADAFPSVALVGGAETAPGDFNGDGILDAIDIDDLTGQSAGGLNPAAYDLNADAAVNSTDVSVWIKDLFNSWIGDANLDGQFNSSDLVAVLASGAYEADVNAVWSTGDFNGDGRANSGDLVAALADGGYEAGPRAATAAVPEPSSLLLLAAMGVGLLVRRSAVHAACRGR